MTTERQVWVCMPTMLRMHVPKQLAKWKAQGYKTAILVDEGANGRDLPLLLIDMLLRVEKYPGVWKSWNALAKATIAIGADAVVLVGDDMDPDPTLSAQEIAEQYFGRYPRGEGVLQPCGDTKGDLIDGWRNAGRICGSPWVGKAWCQQAYNGDGPVCGEYNAFYADEEMLNYAGNMGLLWRREDLTQRHLHWSFGFLPKQDYHDRNQLHWDKDAALFEERRKRQPFTSGRWEKLDWYQHPVVQT